MPGILTALELREKRARIYEEGKAILAAPAGENGALSAEQRSSFERISADLDAMKVEIDRLEKFEAEGRAMEESRAVTRERTEHAAKKGDDKAEAELRRGEAFGAYLRNGTEGLTPEQRSVLMEMRAAQTVTTSGGGYLISQGFSAMLEESMKAFGGMEQAGDVFQTDTGNTLPWPTVDDTTNTGRLLAINTAATETAVTYGQVSFAAYKFSSDMVTVPVELMQDSAFNVEAHIASVLGTRLGRVHNTYQTTGTGSSQPQGIVTGASSGVTAAGVSSVTYDELLALEHSVDPAYRNKAFGPGFVLNDGSLLKLRQIKDSDGRPLWQPGLGAGAADTLSGYPIIINQDMAAMTTGLKPILFGALKKFKIRKVKEITLVRLNERYGELHQVAFLAFTRFDSKVLDAGTDPVKYITMA